MPFLVGIYQLKLQEFYGSHTNIGRACENFCKACKSYKPHAQWASQNKWLMSTIKSFHYFGEFYRVSSTSQSIATDPLLCEPVMSRYRADSRLAPSQWETSLQSNAVSHWLGANLESALRYILPPMLQCSQYTGRHGAALGELFKMSCAAQCIYKISLPTTVQPGIQRMASIL